MKLPSPLGTPAVHQRFSSLRVITASLALALAGIVLPAISASAATNLPTAPSSLSVAYVGVDSLQAAITWSEPSSNGGSPVTGYELQYSSASTMVTPTIVNSASTSTTYTLTLPAAGSFYLRVAATNANGTGPFSLVEALTYQVVGTTPTYTYSCNGSDTLSGQTCTKTTTYGGTPIFAYSCNGSDILSGQTCTQTVTYAATPTPSYTCPASYTLTGSSCVEVVAEPISGADACISAGGVFDSSNDTCTYTVPGTPTTVYTCPNGGRLSLQTCYVTSTYAATATLTGYSCNTGDTLSGSTCTSVSTYAATATVSGSTANNGFAGASTSAPSAPGTPSATAQSSSATLTWAAPTATGALALTGYAVQASSDGGTTWVTLSANTESLSTTFTATSLSNGTSYEFEVAAVNADGPGPFSSPSSAVTPSTVPLAPTALTASSAPGSAVLSWTAPTNTGGSPITSYEVLESIDAGSTWLAVTSSTGSASTTYTVPGLVAGSSYLFEVAATNANGTGAPSSASAPVVPTGPPSAPGAPQVVAGNATATISWTAPGGNGGTPITGYALRYSLDNGATWMVLTSSTGSLSTTYNATGLTNAASYLFEVAAVNAAGIGTYSSPSTPVTPVGPPSAPLSLSATAGYQSVTLTWAPPASTGGSPLTGYVISLSTTDGSTWQSVATVAASTTSYTISGLSASTHYLFDIAAENATGPGDFALTQSALAPLPLSVPSAPRNVQATIVNGTGTISWQAPASDGGAPVTIYSVVATPGNLPCLSVTTSCQMPGLSANVSYTFTVTAHNAVGSSPAASSGTVTVDTSLLVRSISGFAPNSSTLSPSTSRALTVLANQLAALSRTHHIVSLVVQGYADPLKNGRYSHSLALRRSRIAANFLVSALRSRHVLGYQLRMVAQGTTLPTRSLEQGPPSERSVSVLAVYTV